MTSTTTSKPLIKLPNDPVTRLVVDGGSWGDAMILEHSLNIPILEAKLKAAVKKQNPSGERYRAKLLSELAESYSWVGKSRADAEAFVANALAAYMAEKAATKASKAQATATPVQATSQDAWVLLDVEDE